MLKITASLADGIPVDLRDTITSSSTAATPMHIVLAVFRACGHSRSLPGS